jgi:phage terminase large subunit-like protein
MARSLNSERKERRFEDMLIVIERRNGKALLYGQVILFVSLLVTLLWLLIA